MPKKTQYNDERMNSLGKLEMKFANHNPNYITPLHRGESKTELINKGLSSLDQTFKNFFNGSSTWNKQTRDKALLSELYGGLIHNLAQTNNGKSMQTHQRRYQCALLPRRPPLNEALSIGYYFFKEEKTFLEQIYVMIAHPNPEVNRHEIFNLTEMELPQHVKMQLMTLDFPQRHQPAIPHTLHPDLMQWIASISCYNTTHVYPYHIFIDEEITESYCQYFSVEARKPQQVDGETYRSLVTENGWMGSASAFFQNTVAKIYYFWSGPPREYGYDTILNHTDIERQQRLRVSEFEMLLPRIINKFIQKNSAEIALNVREYCEQHQEVGIKR